MKWSLSALAVFAVVLAFAGAQPPQEPIDLKLQQSPPRPRPDWVKMIDQGQNNPRLKGYYTPEGLKVEIVAEEPTVINPVGMTFGADGTLYVLEWVPGPMDNFPESAIVFTYQDGSKRKVAIMRKPVKDVVKTLTDSQGKGVYDQAKVILHEELPSSILVHDGWMYLTGQGTVRRYPLAGIGDPARPPQPQIIAQGFCGFHHHQVSGLTIGNDDWLYVTSGDDDNVVEGSDGSRATVLRTGAVFRMRPDGSKVQTYSMGFRNPYRDVAFDAAFNMFHADNDNEDGSKFTGCRLMHVAETSDFGWRLRQGARCCQPDPVRGAAFGELPGKLAPMLKTGRGAPAGLLIYNDTYFPEPFRGLLLYPDVFRKLIRAYKVEPRGSTFAVTEEFEFMKSADPLFRPCQMVLGPDGAMYICDWRTNSGGAGRLSGDGKHGRIYRVTWNGSALAPAIPRRGLDSWAKIGQQTDADLFKTLTSANFSDRQRAQRALAGRWRRDAQATLPGRTALLKLLSDTEQSTPARIAALGVLQTCWNPDVTAAVVQLLKAGDPDLRRLAAEALALDVAAGNRDVHAALVEHLNDEDPAARRAIVLALGQINAVGTADVLVNALQADDGKDAYLHDGILRALERTGKAGMDRLLELMDSGVARDRDHAVSAFLALRTRPAAEALPQLLKSYHLTPAQKAELVRSYTNYLLDPPVALDPVVEFLATLPRLTAGQPATARKLEEIKALVPVKLAGLEVLSASGALRDERARKLLLALLDETDHAVRLAVIKAIADTRLTAAAPRLVEYLQDVTAPVDERLALLRALGVLQVKTAVPALKAVLSDRSLPATAQGHALRLEALRALGATDAAAARPFAVASLDQDDAALLKEAVQLLGTQPDGALLVGRRFLARKLPRDLLPQVTDVLRPHAGKNPEIARLLTEVMKGGLLVSLDPQEVARVRALVRTRGDARRGRELFLNHKALACITCHQLEGVGGHVGPDLTRIWDTMTVEKIMEAIIDPSKEIKEGYQSYVATTRQGQVFLGLKVAQTAAEVVLKDQTGKEIRIRARDLESLSVSKKSLMPDDVVSQLTFNQFIDLIAFLKNRQAQEGLRAKAPRQGAK